jgi:hypothetical protein
MSSTLYTCISSEPTNYGNAVLRFTPVDNAEYKVVAVNMKADFLVTAKEDEVIFHYPSEQKDLVLTFENKSDYQLSTLVDYLNSIMPSDPDVGFLHHTV